MEHEGVALAEAHVPALEVLSRRVGEDRVRQHGLDSSVNGLPYDRHGEELAVHEFANLIRPGMNQFLQQPVSLQLPCWSRLLSCSHAGEDLALAGSQGRQTRLVNVPLAPKPKLEVAGLSPPLGISPLPAVQPASIWIGSVR